MKLDVLVFAAHPDDAELAIGGTIAALVHQNKKVGIIDLTLGEMGTRGTVETRKLETENASEILGVSYRSNLDLKDSIVENNRQNQLAIIQELRKCRPQICIIGAPDDRHPDHGKATALLIDALFYAGLRNIPTQDDEGHSQEVFRPIHILHYMQDRPFDPDFIFDISDFWDLKQRSVQAYSTQFNVSKPGNEPETYISSQNYFKQLEARARHYGHLGGFELGEPFKYYNGPLGIGTLDVFFKNSPKR